MNQLAIDFSAARIGRDAGMNCAIDHAERDSAGWGDRAYAYLTSYIVRHQSDFMTEDVRLYAAAEGLDPPPDNRAWGAVIVRAVKLGVLRKTGFAPAKTGHCRPMQIWSAA